MLDAFRVFMGPGQWLKKLSVYLGIFPAEQPANPSSQVLLPLRARLFSPLLPVQRRLEGQAAHHELVQGLP